MNWWQCSGSGECSGGYVSFHSRSFDRETDKGLAHCPLLNKRKYDVRLVARENQGGNHAVKGQGERRSAGIMQQYCWGDGKQALLQ